MDYAFCDDCGAVFYITIPIIGCWLYSFYQSIFRRTKTDIVLLYFHIADVLLVGLMIYMALRPAVNCDAYIMEDHYNKYGSEMRSLIKSTRVVLSDSVYFSVEFEDGKCRCDVDALSPDQLKALRRSLDDIDCIGLDIRPGQADHANVRFRRVGMGLYSFELHDRPLTREQRDSINDDYRIIVYDDSTVFVYGGGVWGPQTFVGKEEYIEKRLKR